MKHLVRFAVLGFTVFSTMFWLAVFSLRDMVLGVRWMAYQAEPGAAQHWLFGTLPAVLYGLICWAFLNWFAKRVFRSPRAQ